MARLGRITEQRREKLERIRALGINPYPHRYRRTHTTEQAIALLKQIEDGLTKEEASVAGRITAMRIPIVILGRSSEKGRLREQWKRRGYASHLPEKSSVSIRKRIKRNEFIL